MSDLIVESNGFRYVQDGVLDNGKGDFRLQVRSEYTGRWSDAYYFDNQVQMDTAIEDPEYAKWLTNQPCYIKDHASSQY
tara:strand:- start:4839 stop:5075 length:237 start_codon:yes stop_codon:yes gene_type:complete